MSKEHVGTRLEPEEVARIDALIGPMSEPGRELLRSKVIRILILDSLGREEKRYGIVAADPAPKTRKGGGK
jgi:hypothetical protein